MKRLKLSNNEFWDDQYPICCEEHPNMFNRDMEETSHFRVVKRNRKWLYIDLTSEASEALKEQARYRANWIYEGHDKEWHSTFNQSRTIWKQILRGHDYTPKFETTDNQ